MTLPGTGSQHARDVLQRGFGSAGSNGTNPIVFGAPAGSTLLTNARVHAAVARVADEFARSPLVVGVVSSVHAGGCGPALARSPDRIPLALAPARGDGAHP